MTITDAQFAALAAGEAIIIRRDDCWHVTQASGVAADGTKVDTTGDMAMFPWPLAWASPEAE